MVIIKYGPKLNYKLRELYTQKDNSKEKLNDYMQTFSKSRGIPSAVQISAMIAAYARAEVNKLKNIPDNEAIASNTDSLILRKPLDPTLIGPALGQW